LKTYTTGDVEEDIFSRGDTVRFKVKGDGYGLSDPLWILRLNG